MMRESGRGELKRFGCDQCGQAFEDRSKLSDNMDVHTGTKRHTCSICHKSIKVLGTFRRCQGTGRLINHNQQNTTSLSFVHVTVVQFILFYIFYMILLH